MKTQECVSQCIDLHSVEDLSQCRGLFNIKMYPWNWYPIGNKHPGPTHLIFLLKQCEEMKTALDTLLCLQYTAHVHPHQSRVKELIMDSYISTTSETFFFVCLFFRLYNWPFWGSMSVILIGPSLTNLPKQASSILACWKLRDHAQQIKRLISLLAFNLRDHNWVFFPKGNSVLLPWIQTSLS